MKRKAGGWRETPGVEIFVMASEQQRREHGRCRRSRAIGNAKSVEIRYARNLGFL